MTVVVVLRKRKKIIQLVMTTINKIRMLLAVVEKEMVLSST